MFFKTSKMPRKMLKVDEHACLLSRFKIPLWLLINDFSNTFLIMLLGMPLKNTWEAHYN